MKLLIFFLLCLNSLWAQEYSFPKDFLFGISNAATQVEDNFNGNWMQFAKQGKVAAFKNYYQPEKRIEFWTKPEVEIDLARELGINVFRLSIEWERIEPAIGKYDTDVLDRYIEILKMIRAANMKVMLTLFHHSIPKWADDMGGFSHREVQKSFIYFSKFTLRKLHPYIDYLNTFNEPNVFAMFSRVVGNWPPGKLNPLAVIKLPFYKGAFFTTLEGMAETHKEIYNFSKVNKFEFPIGIAQNTAYYKGVNIFGDFFAGWANENMNFYMLNLVKSHMDFTGMNYYGAEYLGLSGVQFIDEAEYNDAGRAIYVDGFKWVLEKLHKWYQKPIYITENGSADQSNVLRSLYLIEHLKMVSHLIQKGIPIKSYIYWSLSDNFEWSDGYCPKFGLVAVDRKNGFKRIKRPAFSLFQKIIANNAIDPIDEEIVFDRYKESWGKKRTMCRAANGKDGLDTPRLIPLKKLDWRYKYN